MNINKQIMELVEKYDLINRTFEYFRQSYDDYLIEETDEAKKYGLVDRDSVNVVLDNIKFILKNFDENSNYKFMDVISINLEFRLRNDTMKWVGTYACLFYMNGETEGEFKDGEVEDDFFYIN